MASFFEKLILMATTNSVNLHDPICPPYTRVYLQGEFWIKISSPLNIFYNAKRIKLALLVSHVLTIRKVWLSGAMIVSDQKVFLSEFKVSIMQRVWRKNKVWILYCDIAVIITYMSWMKYMQNMRKYRSSSWFILFV